MHTATLITQQSNTARIIECDQKTFGDTDKALLETKRQKSHPFPPAEKKFVHAYQLELDCFDEFTSRFIRGKARQLIGVAGLTESDCPDLIQEFAFELIKRRKKFDPGRAPWAAFVVVVCENCVANILDRRRAEMRSPSRDAGSLNRPVRDDMSRKTDIGNTIAESQQELRTGQRRRPREEMSEMSQDVAHALNYLSPLEREACKRLMEANCKSSVARDLGISQGALYDLLERIRKRFEKMGLREYLK